MCLKKGACFFTGKPPAKPVAASNMPLLLAQNCPLKKNILSSAFA